MPLDLYAPASLLRLLPEALLLVAGCAVLLLGQSARASLKRSVPLCALVSIGAALLVLTLQKAGVFGTALPMLGGGLVFDGLADFVRTGALILGFILTLAAWSQPAESERGEFFALALFSLTGLMLVGAAADLVILFLALELVSVPTYVMVVLSRTRKVAVEAGTKYFYLGAMSAAVMGYGFAFLYGVSGTAALYGADGVVQGVAAALADRSPEGLLRYGLATLGLVFGLGGLLFKIAAVPLHFYIADVYQGSANAVAGFLGFVPKLAGLAAIIKIVALAGWPVQGGLFWVLWLVAAVSMTVGNVLALLQPSVKRMLAYSGIAHSGYMLVGILAGPGGGASGMLGDGTAAVLYYSVVYGLANLAAFAVLALLRAGGRPAETVRDLAGLLRSAPVAALLMALAMFTLMGLPPTAGFWGKLTLFGSALSAAQAPGVAPDQAAWLITLVVVGVLNSALAAAYYLRVVAAVLLYENDRPAEMAQREALHMGTVICGLLLLIFTFYPNVLLRAGQVATTGLRLAAVPPPACVARAEPAGHLARLGP